MSKPLRVLSVTTLFPNAAKPGFGRFVAKQFDALVARCDVDLTVINPIALAPGPLTAMLGQTALASLPAVEDGRGYPVHYPRFLHIPRLGVRWNPALIARAVLPLVRRLHAEQAFDVVDAQFFYPDGPAAARVAQSLGLPLSIKARGSDIHYWGERSFARRQILAAADQAAGLLAVSQALGDDMTALGMAADKIAVHYTGLDAAVFHLRDRAAARADLAAFPPGDHTPVPADGPLLVTVGNLIAIKGQALVIDALQRLPGTRLLIAGNGPDLAALRAHAARLGLADRVHFGSYGPEDLAVALSAADAMVLPSEREGLANVWIEALASGTPLVITDVGGAREVVRSPASGRLIARAPLAIVSAVRDVIANPPDRKVVAAEAARFSWDANAAQLATHYQRIAKT